MNVNIELDGKSLSGVQSLTEIIRKNSVEIHIDRIIYDELSLLSYISDRGRANLAVRAGGPETTTYEGLQIKSAIREMNSDDFIITEKLVLTNEDPDFTWEVVGE